MDLTHWTVVNGVQNPIASLATNVVDVDGVSTAIPAQSPVVGTAQHGFKSRADAPSAVKRDREHVTLTFAEYAVQSPNSDLLSYRQIGHVVLQASRRLH